MTADHPTHMAQLMADTVSFATEHVREGGIPFSAFVVDADEAILGRGVNRVRQHHDPTAHAEVEAIRDACRAHQIPYLQGATLLASGEPCALCYMTAFQAGISQILFSVDRNEAAEHGFDYRSSYSLFASDPESWPTPRVRKLAVHGRLDPFAAFKHRYHCSTIATIDPSA